MTVTIKTNFDQVLQPRIDRLQNFSGEEMVRTIAISMLPVIHDRIHVQGKAADGSRIGTYSFEYMKKRLGSYGNSGEFSKGKKKGKLSDSGVFTKGDNKGSPRPIYNRSGDTKVILSLTRAMELDWSVLPGNNGSYGLGFKNVENFNKSQYAEATYGKPIHKMMDSERDIAIEVAKEYVNRALFE